MTESYSNLLINSFLMAIAIYSVIDAVIDQNRPGWIQKITGRGWLLIACALGVLAVNFYKDKTNEKKLEIADVAKKKDDEKNKKDILIAVDNATNSNISTFTKSLALYNLRYDSGQKAIVKLIRDSSKKVVNNIQDPDPHFGLCLPSNPSDNGNLVIKKNDNNSDSLLFYFCSLYNSSANVKAEMRIVILDDKGSPFVLPGSIIHNEDVPMNTKGDFHFFLGGPHWASASKIYIYFFGSYSKPGGNKSYILNELYQYDLKQRIYFIPSPGGQQSALQVIYNWKKDDPVRKFIDKHELLK